MNSRLHIIVCGRAGFDYDYEENEETGRKDLIKTGVKMKTEGEFGFEPSLLVEMERIQDLSGEHTRILHRATVIGDRFGVIDGKTCDDPAFAFFKPHLEMLTPGAHAPIDTQGKTVVAYEGEGDRDWAREKEQRDIFCEEIQGLMVEKWPGQTSEEKAAKHAFIEQLFGTRSWTKVQGLDSRVLKEGFEKARALLRPPMTDAVAGDSLIPFGETEPEKVETKPAKDETTAKPRRRKKLEEPDFIPPRESFLLVKMATLRGWTESEFVSALAREKGIAGPDFIPVERYEEIVQMIEGGNDPAPVTAQVVLEGMQCH